jgi:uncharacterized protein (TIGR04255 family)
MSLKKPPLVEVWMSFRFDPSPGAPAWNEGRYQVFLETVADTHVNVQHMVRKGIRINNKRGKRPRIESIAEEVMAVRAISENGLRIVQLTADELIVNYLRGDTEPYPGFPTLLDEAIAHCGRYDNCYHPLGIIEVSLHYVDAVEIPVQSQGNISSEDYFKLNFQVPEDVFGRFSAFDIKATVHPPSCDEAVQLSFATEPTEIENSRRFRLEWHTGAKNKERMNSAEVRARMQSAHDRLYTCFKHAFTPKGWSLFEPEQ